MSARHSGRSTGDGPDLALYLPNLESGGAERMMVALARGMAGRGLKVDMVLAHAHGPYLGEVPDEVRVVDLAARGSIASLPGLVAYLRRERPPVALATLPHAAVVLVWARALAGTGTRIYLREATTPSAVRQASKGWRGRLVPLATRLFYPRADGVIAVSRGVAQDLHENFGIPWKIISTLYNPVVTGDLALKAEERLDDPWFREGEPPVVLSVGRLGREKDFPTLLRAFARLRERRPARLLILGEGAERGTLERLAGDLGLGSDFRLPGFVPNPFRYMANASVYVLSSEREGLPGSLIQAMACGCPVISTDCPSGPAEVLQNGEYGELVPVGDDEAMAAAMERALDDPLDPAALRERASHFSEDRSIDSYQELLFGRVVRRVADTSEDAAA